MLKAMRTMLIVLLNVLIYGLVVFGGIDLCRLGYQFACATVADTSKDLPPGKDVTITIGEQDDQFDVATYLEKEGLVVDRYSFYLRMQLEREDGVYIRPGTFSLNSSMTYEEIRRIIYQKQL